MNILKFGGASVKSAEGIKNLATITNTITTNQIIVVSAMDKMTNVFEKLCHSYFYKESSIDNILNDIYLFHTNIIKKLFNETDNIHSLFQEIFDNLKNKIDSEPALNYDFEYDQIVCYGEILSTLIVSEYLNKVGQKNKWIDIRKCIKTDSNFRNADVNWELSTELCENNFNFQSTFKYVTQGFIAGTETNLTTTLGREGSDYTASILANILEAENVTIWKDVPGIMNADPKEYDDAITLKKLSYKECLELAYCGAKIIHPNTIKPLQNKNIPLYVKSFISPQEQGSLVYKFEEKLCLEPIFIHKDNQILISLTPRDFSFISEKELSNIFSILAKNNVTHNLIQTSAISFSICINNYEKIIEKITKDLNKNYSILYNENVELITIRHYNETSIDRLTLNRNILVEQRSRLTARFVIES